jgi:hypothetical protein
MLSGSSPFKDASEWLIFQRIIARDVKFPEYFSDEARDLIDKLLVCTYTHYLYRICAQVPPLFFMYIQCCFLIINTANKKSRCVSSGNSRSIMPIEPVQTNPHQAPAWRQNRDSFPCVDCTAKLVRERIGFETIK